MLGVVSGGEEILPWLYTKVKTRLESVRCAQGLLENRASQAMEPYKKRNQARGTTAPPAAPADPHLRAAQRRLTLTPSFA